LAFLQLFDPHLKLSALGQKRTYAVQKVMSALAPKATSKCDRWGCLLRAKSGHWHAYSVRPRQQEGPPDIDLCQKNFEIAVLGIGLGETWFGRCGFYSPEECAVATLHIEHGITDFSTWKANFDRFAVKRSEAGVTAHRIYQPHDNAAYVVIQLDFPSVEQAQAYREFLEAHVWSTPTNSPALVGSPRACVLVATAEQ